jgi:hypothetical protein
MTEPAGYAPTFDYTARHRDRLLRETGQDTETYDPVEHPGGDFTGRLSRELRARHDGGDYDDEWLRTHGTRMIWK